MLLAIDVGNTQTVLGVYDGEHLVHMWRVATNVDHTSDELRIKLHVLMEAEGVDPKCIDGAILASVVPALGKRRAIARSAFSCLSFPPKPWGTLSTWTRRSSPNWEPTAWQMPLLRNVCTVRPSLWSTSVLLPISRSSIRQARLWAALLPPVSIRLCVVCFPVQRCCVP